MTRYRTTRAVVLSQGNAFYDDGRTHPVAAGLDLTDLPTVLAGGARAFTQGTGATGEGVVLVDTDVPSLMSGITQRAPQGWEYSELRPWTTFRHPKGVTVHLGAYADPHFTSRPLFNPGGDNPDDPERMAYLLGRYHELTGAPYFAIPGVSGLGGLRAKFSDPRPGRQPLWVSGPLPRHLRGAGPLVWSRKLAPDAAGHVHVFDINSMYLAAMKAVQVAWGALKHTGAVLFDASWAGYWQIGIGEIPAALYDGRTQPPVFPARADTYADGVPGATHGATWVTTPVMEYLATLGVHPDVLDSWTCDNKHPVMRTYAERLGAARIGQLGDAPAEARDAIKTTYTQMVGLMGRAAGRVYRPDWQHSIMDLARMNLLRRLDKAFSALGVRPFAVRTDAAYFLAADPSPKSLGLALGTGVAAGLFKFAETLTVEDATEKLWPGARV